MRGTAEHFSSYTESLPQSSSSPPYYNAEGEEGTGWGGEGASLHGVEIRSNRRGSLNIGGIPLRVVTAAEL